VFSTGTPVYRPHVHFNFNANNKKRDGKSILITSYGVDHDTFAIYDLNQLLANEKQRKESKSTSIISIQEAQTSNLSIFYDTVIFLVT